MPSAPGLTFHKTRPEEAGAVAAFVQRQAHPNLMRRPLWYFRDAARDGRLVHAAWSESHEVMGVVSFAPEPDEGDVQVLELTGLLLDPDLRGYGVGDWLVCAAMVYHEGQAYDRESAYIAHVVEGNTAPVGALTRNGFAHQKMVHVPKGALGGALDHLAQPDADHIVGHEYRFDTAALDRLIVSLDDLLRGGAYLSRTDPAGRIRINLDARLVSRDALREHRRHLGV